MIRTLTSWYKRSSSNKKLLVHFILQWVYWAFAWWLFKKLWSDDRPATIMEILVQATWMAVWMSVVFNWKTVKAIFTRKKIE